MRKLSALLLLALLPFAARESYDFADCNLDIARAAFAKRALELGRKDVFDAQISKIKNPRNIPSDTGAPALKKKIMESDSLPQAEVLKFLSGKHEAGDKLLICGSSAAKSFESGNIKTANFYLTICNSIFKNGNPTAIESAALETVDILSDISSKDAQRAAAELLFKLNYSHDMVLLAYKLCGKKYCAERFAELLKDKNFCKQNKAFLKYAAKAKIISAIDKYKEDYVLRNFYYSAIEFSMSWKIQKWQDYKNPLLAHVYHCGGNEAMYKKYKEKSISPTQLYEMRGAYFQYVEYAAKIFCMANDAQTAIDLLKTLPAGHRKNRSLKRLAPYLSATKDSLEATLSSGLFD